jgi:hypothetical protein
MTEESLMKSLIVSLGLLFASSAFGGLPVYLESQSGIGNGMKECVYSDRSVITVKADQDCPPTNDSDPSMGSNEIPDVDDDQNDVDE